VIPHDLEIRVPWLRLDQQDTKLRAQQLATELKNELSPGHLLFKIDARAVATRIDRDDVLFEIEHEENRLAVVHLTWRRESNPNWPTVKLFRGWDQWARGDGAHPRRIHARLGQRSPTTGYSFAAIPKVFILRYKWLRSSPSTSAARLTLP